MTERPWDVPPPPPLDGERATSRLARAMRNLGRELERSAATLARLSEAWHGR